MLALAPFAIGRAQTSATVDSTAPRRGTWAGEVAFGGGTSASILRFRSPRSAWLLGAEVSALHLREENPETPFEPATTETSIFVNLLARAGRRNYARVGDLRPFHGAGIIGGYFHTDDQDAWNAGVYGELGASYFFTPHVSLGTAGEVNATYGERRASFFVGKQKVQTIGLSAIAVRVLGTVYF